ncbi:hypothetical protein SK128_007073 [Halocaridina rubra]|uniref:C2H2-type domain-containing protein n=1 Tax=Halocaridina rubra TaxID=373956 RepID=A0AAN9A9P1_HALRR
MDLSVFKNSAKKEPNSGATGKNAVLNHHYVNEKLKSKNSVYKSSSVVLRKLDMSRTSGTTRVLYGAVEPPERARKFAYQLVPQNNFTKIDVGVHMPQCYALRCSLCPEYFEQKINLYKHFQRHIEYSLFSCKICLEICKSPAALEAHYHHNRSTAYCHCFLCMKKVDHNRMALHIPKCTIYNPDICKICRKRFSDHTLFTLHMQDHLKDDRLRCKDCGVFVVTSSHNCLLKKSEVDSFQRDIRKILDSGKESQAAEDLDKAFSYPGDVVPFVNVNDVTDMRSRKARNSSVEDIHEVIMESDPLHVGDENTMGNYLKPELICKQELFGNDPLALSINLQTTFDSYSLVTSDEISRNMSDIEYESEDIKIENLSDIVFNKDDEIQYDDVKRSNFFEDYLCQSLVTF